MKAWLRERPWIWIVVFFAVLMAASAVTVVIAEWNRPEVVKASVQPGTAAKDTPAARTAVRIR